MNQKELFLEVSILLTGFEDLRSKISDEYYDRISVKYSDQLNDFLAVYDSCGSKSLDELKAKIGKSKDLKTMATLVIYLWYTSELLRHEYISDSENKPKNPESSDATPEQYYNSLVWRSARAHVKGLSGGYFGYWKYKPEN